MVHLEKKEKKKKNTNYSAPIGFEYECRFQRHHKDFPLHIVSELTKFQVAAVNELQMTIFYGSAQQEPPGRKGEIFDPGCRPPARVISIIKDLFLGAFGEAVKAELVNLLILSLYSRFPPLRRPHLHTDMQMGSAISDTASPFLKCHTHTDDDDETMGPS